MANLKATKGAAISARKWNQLVDRLPEEAIGFGVGGFRLNQTAVQVVNDSGADRDVGEVIVLSDFDGPTSDIYDAINTPMFTAEQSSWHTSIASMGVFLEPVPGGERGMVAISGLAMVKLSAAPDADHTHVFIDDQTTTVCRPSYSGVGKILATLSVSGSEYAMVSIGDCQNLWRYELLQDSVAPAPTNATLQDRRGNACGTISLRDPLALMSDQKIGDQGWCYNCGNEFEAIQAPCG